MGIRDWIKSKTQDVITWAMGGVSYDPLEKAHQEHQKGLVDLLAYYNGKQRLPLKLTTLGKNYNVIANHVKTIIDRSVSMLVGAGVDFDLPGEGDTPQGQIINKVWDANNKDVVLHDLAQYGSIYGTMAMKIIPDGRMSITGETTFRLVPLNPFNLTIYTKPDDIDEVIAYVFRWQDGEVGYREVTGRGIYTTAEDGKVTESSGWTIELQQSSRETYGRWDTVTETPWVYDFPPIAHGKNLPNAGNVYGCSDIEGILELQDRYNETQSNINKILSLQAWAQKYITGGKWPRTVDDDGKEYIDMSPDKALEISNAEAKVGILQPSGDLDSSRLFANDIRRDMFDIAATVDSETVKDKVGALTNFGLRVLFKNELAKNATKQLLYGDLLLNVNNRLLQLAGYTGEQADPGKVIFGDPLPVNDTEEIQAIQSEMSAEILSKESAAKRRGIDWEVEKKRLADDKQTADNLGGDLLRKFMAGRNDR